MAKAAASSQSPPSKVKDSLKRVRAFHALGTKSLKGRSGAAKHHEQEINREAKELGINPDTLRKARHFADPDRGYSKDELDQLCEACEQAEYAIGTTRIIRLLSIPSKQRRKALQGQAIKRRWSKRDLNREISKKHSPRKLGGRRKQIPTNVSDFLTDLLGKTESWRRWYAELNRVPVAGKRKVAILEGLELPVELTRRIVQVSRTMARLHDQVTEELMTTVPGRSGEGSKSVK